MPLEIVLGGIGVLGLFGVITVVFGPADRAARRALVTGIILMPLLPLNGAIPSAIVIGFGAILLSFVAAILKSHPRPRRMSIVVSALLVLVGMRVSTYFTEGNIGLLASALTVILCLGIFVVGRLTEDDILALATAFSVVMVLHIAYATLEVSLRIPGIWPMSDGSNEITQRAHEILPWLPGRPMTSFSHPIPLAYFMLVSVAFAAYAGMRKRRWQWISVFVGIAGIVLTGTRSALIALAVIVGIAFVSTFRLRRVVVIIVMIALALVVLRSQSLGNTLRLVGLGEDFSGTASYRHRAMVSASFPGLFNHDAGHVLFGWGTDIHWIFDTGIVPRYSSTFYFFDNQFVASMAQFGLFGLLLLAVALVLAFAYGNSLARMLVGALVAMSFSFDGLTHFVGLFSFVLLIGLASVKRADESAQEPVELAADSSALPTRVRGYADRPARRRPLA